MKITKRNIIFFFAGILTLFLIQCIIDWEGTIGAMTQGFKDGYNDAPLKR